MITVHRCFARALRPNRGRLFSPNRDKLTFASYDRSAIKLSHRQPLTTSRPQPPMELRHTTPAGDSITVHFSANQPADLPKRLAPLLQSWELTPSGKGVKKVFLFTTFSNAWKFMDTVAQQCKVMKHHPEWSNLYNKVTVEWTTHRPEGLSVKDVDMAEFCDQTASQIGLKSA